MKFGEFAVEEALDAVLAHTIRVGDRRFPKGHRLVQDDLAALSQLGVSRVIAARLDPGDLLEDEAADRVAHAIDGAHLQFSAATTGRVNVFSTVNGLFRVSRDAVDRLNRIDPAITLASLKDFADVRAGDMVATIKIIPLAVSGMAVAEAVALVGAQTPFEMKPYGAREVALIATRLPSLKTSVMDKTRRLLDVRLQPMGSRVDIEQRVAHTAEAVAKAIADVVEGHGMVVVFGASAVADAEDVIPAAIRLAGGSVQQVGLPVDPGNLLVLGKVGNVPVIGAPGCARSPKENAFDWILSRIFAGEAPDTMELTGLGVGGLLMEIPTRPQPRLAEKSAIIATRVARVATVILAAGQARRMGASGKHKLLARFSGVPLVRKSVETVLASQGDSAVVVTGYRAGDIEAAIAGLDIAVVHNRDFAVGMASSLKAGLAAVRDAADGILVMLADMPEVTTRDLDRMIEAFRAEEGRAIIRAVSGGKRGNPVILPSQTFDAVLRLDGDIGARPIIEKSGLPVIDVDIGEGAHIDTDTPEEIIAAGGVLAD